MDPTICALHKEGEGASVGSIRTLLVHPGEREPAVHSAVEVCTVQGAAKGHCGHVLIQTLSLQGPRPIVTVSLQHNHGQLLLSHCSWLWDPLHLSLGWESFHRRSPPPSAGGQEPRRD